MTRQKGNTRTTSKRTTNGKTKAYSGAGASCSQSAAASRGAAGTRKQAVISHDATSRLTGAARRGARRDGAGAGTTYAGAVVLAVDLTEVDSTIDRVRNVFQTRADMAFRDSLAELDEHICGLKDAAETGCHEAQILYGKVVAWLRSAADQGRREARDMLNGLGEGDGEPYFEYEEDF
ncbi:MAG: hypothetical protein EHM48_05410 [Planctomycetaceae bacterium]|nr:MAG: hypothetical protein EHM48_05410 [Planctomycetaceae bacterium]